MFVNHDAKTSIKPFYTWHRNSMMHLVQIPPNFLPAECEDSPSILLLSSLLSSSGLERTRKAAPLQRRNLDLRMRTRNLHSSPGSTGYVNALTRRSPIGQLEELAFCWFRGLLSSSSSSLEQFCSQALGGSLLCWFTPEEFSIIFIYSFLGGCCWL